MIWQSDRTRINIYLRNYRTGSEVRLYAQVFENVIEIRYLEVFELEIICVVDRFE